MIDALRQSRTESGREPYLVIAHTFKGWGLECLADPANHSTLPSEKRGRGALGECRPGSRGRPLRSASTRRLPRRRYLEPSGARVPRRAIEEHRAPSAGENRAACAARSLERRTACRRASTSTCRCTPRSTPSGCGASSRRSWCGSRRGRRAVRSDSAVKNKELTPGPRAALAVGGRVHLMTMSPDVGTVDEHRAAPRPDSRLRRRPTPTGIPRSEVFDARKHPELACHGERPVDATHPLRDRGGQLHVGGGARSGRWPTTRACPTLPDHDGLRLLHQTGARPALLQPVLGFGVRDHRHAIRRDAVARGRAALAGRATSRSRT